MMRTTTKELIDKFNEVKGYIDAKLALMIATTCLLLAGMLIFSVAIVVREIGAEEAPVATVTTTYSEEDAVLLAQVMLNEAGGIPSQTEQSMVAWTVLNRVDDGRFGGSIYEVLAAPAQFAWWSGTSVRDDLLALARDVLERYAREQSGETEVGRTLPPDKLYFYGDGAHNYFYSSSGGDAAYSFSDYSTPYQS